MRVREWRPLAIDLGNLVWTSAELAAKTIRGITEVITTPKVRHSGLSDSCLETIRVPDDPAGRESAMRGTPNTQALRVRETTRHRRIDRAHVIRESLAAPIAHDGACKFFAIACRAAKVSEHDTKALGGQKPEVVPEGMPCRNVRTAVNEEH